jgi:ribonucleoside-diphosphate reductase alpha chain
MKLSNIAQRILKERYLSEGETPEQMLRRVASTVAYAEDHPMKVREYTELFYDMMSNLDFLPNSPTLMNAGKELGQLSACFVLPIDDSMDGICDSLKHQAVIHKSGGGTGFSFSRLRPEGSKVGSTGGVASGPISFMRVYNEMTETVKQGGKRRGANMGCLSIHHPDIEKFIDAKLDKTVLTNFNISVLATDDFMEAVKVEDQLRCFEIFHNKAKIEPYAARFLNAKNVLRRIATNAHANGEPGVLFIDKVNDKHPLAEEVESTNPCGEQPLLPYESCNLGSINLANMVSGMGKPMKYSVDWDKLAKTVTLAVRFLDNVIDVNKYPLKSIEDKTREGRKIGLGVMGLADMFIKLGIKYDTEKAVSLSRKVAKFIQEHAHKASVELAKERGAFPVWPDGVKPQYVAEWGEFGRRNATVTTIAPTGTLSIIADCSGGIEPNFAFEMMRVQGNDKTPTKTYHPLYERHINNGEFSKGVFREANDIDWLWHLKHQAVWQEFVENAVSKTINMPPTATVDDVYNAYVMAWEMGCKGVTVYRDGSRDSQVLSKAPAEKPAEMVKPEAPKQPVEQTAVSPQTTISAGVRPRPEELSGKTIGWKTGCGMLYVTVNFDEDGKPLEIFVNDGGAGGCMSQSAAITKVISLGLRSGLPTDAIVKKIKGIRCPSCTNRGLRVLSCPDAIARTIERMVKSPAPTKKVADSDIQEAVRKGVLNAVEKAAERVYGASYGVSFEPVNNANDAGATSIQPGVESGGDKCPDCGAVIKHASGCVQCIECGWSKCS